MAFCVLTDGKVLLAGQCSVEIDGNSVLAGSIRQCWNINFAVAVGPHVVPGLAGGSGAYQLATLIADGKEGHNGVLGATVGFIELYNKGGLTTHLEAGGVVRA